MENSTVLHIGFDDTDSPKGMCTTFLAFKIVNYLKTQDLEFLDYPKLIRFNPNIPWKTRGNGAVSLKIRTEDPEKIKNKIKNFVSKYSDTKNGANPGLVFYENTAIPSKFTEFSELALWQLINRNHAKEFASKNNLEVFYKGNGQGLVGAIGAIGYNFDDHTLELLSYRKRSKFGKERKISAQSVKTMQQQTFPHTFNSFDYKKSRVLITPHGPDPVFYGVRGEKIESLLEATKILETKEKLDGHMIFKSNQGTGDHLKNTLTKASKTHPRTLNLEFIQILNLEKNISQTNPLCVKCNKKMKSKGKNQGYKCVKCGKTAKKKTSLEIPRKIKKQQYIPDISAHRHLSRPITRIGKANKNSKFDNSSSWFSLYEN
jgi:tRNA(Ile2)-agmatinylcytidine synthase